MKKASSLFLILLLLILLIPCGISASEVDAKKVAFSDKAKAIYLYSYDADRVIFSKGGEEKLHPASTVKMMTGLLACEVYYDKLDNSVTVKQDMLDGVSGTSMNLKDGMVLTLKELLYGTICGGNNDAATVLAIFCAGSVDSFVEQMNKYAKAWDMRDTHYSNPTGIDSSEAYTTIFDVAKLSKKAASNPLYLEISSAPSYKLNGYDYTISNRNALISQFSAQGYLNKSASGLIAGGTDEGGFVVATYATKNENSFLCIVMGATSDITDIYSYKISNELLSFAFDGYSLKKVANLGESFGDIEVSNALIDRNGAFVSALLNEDLYAFLPENTDIDKLTFKPYFHNNVLEAPIEENSVIGGVLVYCDDILVGEGKLVSDKAVEPNSLLLVLDIIRSFFLGRKFLIMALIAIPCIIIYLLAFRRVSQHKKAATVKFKNFY